jgi:hypothetical protein
VVEPPSQTARLGIPVHAGLEAAVGDDLFPGPDLECEGVGATAKDGEGAVIGLLQGQDDTTAAHPDEGGAEEIIRQLQWQLAAHVVFARWRKSRSTTVGVQ